MLSKMCRLVIAVGLATVIHLPAPAAGDVFEPEDVLSLRYASSAVISPDGRLIAYTVSVPRAIDDDSGARYAELHVVPTRTGESRPFVTGKVNISSVRFSPDGRKLSFRMKRGEKKARTQVWTIPVDGGEATQVTHSKTDVIAYDWHPKGDRIVYTATADESKREKKLDEMGYGFVYYEENLKPRKLYIENISDDTDTVENLNVDLTVWSVHFSPDGTTLALGASRDNLIDQRYAFHRIYLYDVETGEIRPFTKNPGKLGTMEWSPDGTQIAYTAALTQDDHAVSQVFVQSVAGGEARNLTVSDFRGHVHWAGWRNASTVVYRASEGVWTTLSSVKESGGKRTMLFDSENEQYSFSDPTHADGFAHIAFTATSPQMPSDVYYWTGKGKPRRLTELNPWIADRELGRCETITYKARDGWEVEGLLWYPVDYEPANKVPLVVAVHGGPEAHHSWSWRTSYSRPVEVLTGQGYAVFLPNYRASTGYGLAHTKAHFGDAAGVEFDDVADGIRHLIDIGLADPDRVGLGGGSYGGFAAAWFSTYYTDLVKASVMFVGISDLISKRGTTDIPYEELYVHSGDKLEDMWESSLKRSPIYYAHQSHTATLIIGGKNDTRVHPSQSLELYRRMKMNGHPAVRLVQYPGEGHGNARMPGRRDVLYRTLQWYDWFVKGNRPIEGGMPGADISDLYPIELPDKETGPAVP